MRPPKSTHLLLALIGLMMAAWLAGAGNGTTRFSASAARAQGEPLKLKAVIELFTSQGCSSCPKADALLKTYADRADVVALTMPVDYWDYLGWKDTLASPRNTARQRAYAGARGDGQVYTPQVVVNGVEHVVGSSKALIELAIAKTTARFAQAQVPIQLSMLGGALVIKVAAAPAGKSVAGATIWLATVKKKIEIPIKRGENRGRSITYYNVVRSMTSVGMWDGKALNLRLAQHAVMHGGANRCIVLLQRGPAGPIIGAAEIDGM